MDEAMLGSRSFLPTAALRFRPVHEHRAGSILILPSTPSTGLCLGVKVEGLDIGGEPGDGHGVMVLQGSPWPDGRAAVGELLVVRSARGLGFDTAVPGGRFDTEVQFPLDAPVLPPARDGWADRAGALALGGSGPRLIAAITGESARLGAALEPASWRVDRTAREDEQQVWVGAWSLVLRWNDEEARIAVSAAARGV